MNTPENKQCPQSHDTAPSCPPQGEIGSTQPGGWQDIATAPRDGTIVLLWDGGNRFTGMWWGRWVADRDHLDTDGDANVINAFDEPKLWAPILDEPHWDYEEQRWAWDARADDGKGGDPLKGLRGPSEGTLALEARIADLEQANRELVKGLREIDGMIFTNQGGVARAQCKQLIEQHGGTE